MRIPTPLLLIGIWLLVLTVGMAVYLTAIVAYDRIHKWRRRRKRQAIFPPALLASQERNEILRVIGGYRGPDHDQVETPSGHIKL